MEYDGVVRYQIYEVPKRARAQLGVAFKRVMSNGIVHEGNVAPNMSANGVFHNEKSNTVRKTVISKN